MIATTEPRSSSDVLGHLLHSLCQPLTVLRCSLELSLDEFTEHQCQNLAVALDQTERAIEAVELIREYLELEQACKQAQAIAVCPVIDAVLSQLSVVAEARQIPLLVWGTSPAVLPVNEFWLQRALRYLLAMWLEDWPRRTAMVIVMEQHTSHSLVCACRLPCGQSDRLSEHAVISGHLQQAKLAIARRVLEAAGAALEFSPGGRPGFAIRIPHAHAMVHQLTA